MIIVNNPRWFGIARGIYSNQGGLGDQIWVFNFDNNADYIAVPFTVGEWVHITMVHTGGTLYAYKNGVLVGSTTSGDTGGFPPPDNSGGAMSFGGGFAGTNPPMFRGQIDEVAFYRVPATPPAFDEALIRDWMYKEMEASFPHWDDLAAYYKMSNGSGTTVTNDRGNSAFNGTMLGSPDWISSGAFAGPRNGLAFNGSDESVDIPDNFTLDMTSSFT